MKWFIHAIVLLFAMLTSAPVLAQYNVLHKFVGGSADGNSPDGALILSGSTLYGTTSGGGTSGIGTVFKVGVNGAGFGLLHSFAGGSSDGYVPRGSLIQSGSTLFGMTAGNGLSQAGTIFQIGTNGTGFGVLHAFAGGTDGAYPNGSLIQSGSTFYGTTSGNQSAVLGTIFKVGTSGTGFTTMHSFTGGSSDGAYSLGSLVQSGSTLYGMTEDGGTANKGTIFQIGTDGTGFSLLHSFAGGSADGSFPQGSLILSGSTLYGTTANGGSASKGTLFKIDTNGTGFSLVHSFSGGANDGSNPQDAPILIGSTLYGMTNAGGSVDAGTIYQIATNGTGLSLLHTFTGTAGDGYYPLSSLIQSGPILYGMTSSGPAGSGNGVVFSLSLVTGDYDGNGSVDAADYVVWRKTDGSAGGYNTWRANFGKPFGSGSLADGTIPEPTSLALAAFVLVGGLLGLSRRAGRQKSA